MSCFRSALPRVVTVLLALVASALVAAEAPPGLLFHLSGDQGTTADFSAAGTAKPTFNQRVSTIADGAVGGALQCDNLQLLAYRAPGNIYAQRGTLSFFWRSRYPVGPTEFPIFRVGYADHSSWDMVFLRIDYNGHGFDAFVTDASLARTRVSATLTEFPGPKTWTHIAFAWDETQGVRLYINGKLAAQTNAKARYDAALDQFGPHSRVISPYQVQSDYNFVRGGDIDEIRIYDHMLDVNAVTALATKQTPQLAPTPARSLSDPAIRQEWYHRFGWDREAPALLPEGRTVAVRKIEIHNAYDLKRWWWKATDGIRETTWPGVYNRSRLPGRNDYFQLPDWDCYVQSGKAVTFALPSEPWNHVEIAGSAWGKMERLADPVDLENASSAAAKALLFERPKGVERSVHRLGASYTGSLIRFTNVEQEEPIGEIVAYNVSAGSEPKGSQTLAFKLVPHGRRVGAAGLSSIESYIDGRFPSHERARLSALPADKPLPDVAYRSLDDQLPIAHVLIENTWDQLADGLDGISIDLPALAVRPTHGEFIVFNIQVKDPLWPGRNLLDFTFSAKPNEARTLWLDTRDRILPEGRPLWISVASSSPEFSDTSLNGAGLRLVFKPRDAARAEHEIDRFTQVRDVYAMLVEERPGNAQLDMYNRYMADITDLLRVNPDHVLGRLYAFAGIRGPLPGTKKPDYTAPEVPAGVPAWAFRQVFLLGQVKRFVTWYIDHRQVPYGDFGGGISDDSDLTNIWPGVALMGSEPEKIRASLAALLDAAYRNGMVTRGLPTIQTDELHTYEEGINALAQILLLEHGSPRQIERAMETARGLESITGVNGAGHRHIRSSYYGATRMAEEDPWGYAKPYSYLVLQVPQALVEFNGNPRTRTHMLEIADGLLAHMRPGRSGTVPSIRFADDSEEAVGRGWYPIHVFWGAYQFSGDKRYLGPLLANAMNLQYANANTLDLLGLRAELQARPPTSGHLAWQVTGDKSHLDRLYAAQSEACSLQEYINTSGSLWTDRVSVPLAELQRARLGGIALMRNGLYPGHVVSWRFAAPANDQSVAVLVPQSTATQFKVLAYNLENSPVTASMTGWNIDPGLWEITQGVDDDGDDQTDGNTNTRTAVFERSRSLDFVLPPRSTTVLTMKLKTPGTPLWQRADLGIDREDVSARENGVQVRVHSLGSIDAPPSTVALRDRTGRVFASTRVPPLPAPLDLMPRVTDVTIPVPVGTSLSGVTVELNSDQQFEEITAMNNTVKL